MVRMMCVCMCVCICVCVHVEDNCSKMGRKVKVSRTWRKIKAPRFKLRSDGRWYLGWGRGAVQQRLSAASLALALQTSSPYHFHPPVTSESLPEGGLWLQEVLTMWGVKASGIGHPKIETRGVQNMPALNMPLWCINCFELLALKRKKKTANAERAFLWTFPYLPKEILQETQGS